MPTEFPLTEAQADELLYSLGTYVVEGLQKLRRSGITDPRLAAGSIAEGLIACAMRNPEWGQMFRLDDESTPGIEPGVSDGEILANVPIPRVAL